MNKHASPLLYWGTLSLGVACLLSLLVLSVLLVCTNPRFIWLMPAIAILGLLCIHGVGSMISVLFTGRTTSRREKRRMALLQEYHHFGTSEARRCEIAKDADFSLTTWD